MGREDSGEDEGPRYLGDAEVERLGGLLAAGVTPGLKEVHAAEAAKVWASAIRRRTYAAKEEERERWRREAAERRAAEGEELVPWADDLPPGRPRPPMRPSGRVPRPSAVLLDFLGSREGSLLLLMVSGMVALSSWALRSVIAPPGDRMALRPGVQAIWLARHLRRRAEGRPVIVSEAERLWPELRSWAAALSPEGVREWAGAGRVGIGQHLGELCQAGAELHEAYAPGLRRLGITMNGLPPAPRPGRRRVEGLGLPVDPPEPGGEEDAPPVPAPAMGGRR
ncbi:hypothetical protein VQH23_26510 (plasmid) [Pararoseomonas sp. SCSIO 73927]|uniref:hypothetical protein n=1 Tax=Pararoseomonas sp. SCSIO 73927 TaxID=3114537 RepID=UPI0030CD1614